MNNRTQILLHLYEGESHRTIDVSNLVANWQDIAVEFENNSNDVTQSITTQFDFVLGAREALFQHFNKYLLDAKASVEIYTLNQNWEYEKIYTLYIDFTSIKYDNSYLSVNCIDNTLSAILADKNNEKYQLSCDDILDDRNFVFQFPTLKNTVYWDIQASDWVTENKNIFSKKVTVNAVGVTKYIPIPMTYRDSNTFRGGFTYYDQTTQTVYEGEQTIDPMGKDTTEFHSVLPDDYIINVVKKTPIKLNLKFLLRVHDDSEYYFKSRRFVVGRISQYNVIKELYSEEITGDQLIIASVPITEVGKIGVFVKVVTQDGKSGTTNITIETEKVDSGYFRAGSIAYAESMSIEEDIEYKCVNVPKLLNKLVKNIVGRDVSTGIVDYDNRTVLLPTSLISTNIENPQIETSFNDFNSFMKCLGYKYIFENEGIYYYNVKDIYNKNTVNEISDTSDAELTISEEYCISSIKTGEEDDTEYFMGEYNTIGNIEYSTGVTINQNQYNIGCSYHTGYIDLMNEIINNVQGHSDTNSKIYAIHTSISYYNSQVKRLLVKGKPLYLPQRSAYSCFSESYYGVENVYGEFVKKCYIKYPFGLYNFYLTITPIDNNNIGYQLNAFDENKNKIDLGFRVIEKPRKRGIDIIETSQIYIEVDMTRFVESRPINIPLSFTSYPVFDANNEFGIEQLIKNNEFFISASSLNFRPTKVIELYTINNNYISNLFNDISLKDKYVTPKVLSFKADNFRNYDLKNNYFSVKTSIGNYTGYLIKSTKNINRMELPEYQLLLE